MTAKRTHKYVPAAPVKPAKELVLVVDDEKAQRELLTAVLGAVYQVVAVPSVAQALIKAEQMPPALVIMDYAMPDMTGLEGLGKFKTFHPDVPVVILTGHADLDLARSVIQEGAVEFILKPFGPADLLTMVARCIGQPQNAGDVAPEVPYSIQRRLAGSVDLWRSRLPTVSAENRVEVKLADGVSVEAKVLRLSRNLVQAEVYDPNLVLSGGLPIEKIEVWVGGELAYAGPANLNNVIATGVTRICEFAMAGEWTDGTANRLAQQSGGIEEATREFVQRWEATRSISPGFMLAVADAAAFLTELRSWIEGLELTWFYKQASGNEPLERLLALIKPAMDGAFASFEAEAAKVPQSLMGLHAEYLRASLHPTLLCAPFIHRCFTKPLGYPGDYGVMNRMLDDPFEGEGLFARILNAWVIRSSAGDAYRHRVYYLEKLLREQLARVTSQNNRECRVLSLGCGAAREVQKFIQCEPNCDKVSFTLLDFSADTVLHAQQRIQEIAAAQNRTASVTAIEFSVQQMLAAGSRLLGQPDQLRSGMLERGRYDVIYCAGLFDYLSDRVCKRLLEIFWELAAPGATIVVSNFAPANPIRGFMDYVLDWRLIYRSEQEVRALAVSDSLQPNVETLEAAGGTEVFLRMTKPSIVKTKFARRASSGLVPVA